jgi:hypothetical protein
MVLAGPASAVVVAMCVDASATPVAVCSIVRTRSATWRMPWHRDNVVHGDHQSAKHRHTPVAVHDQESQQHEDVEVRLGRAVALLDLWIRSAASPIKAAAIVSAEHHRLRRSGPKFSRSTATATCAATSPSSAQLKRTTSTPGSPSKPASWV